MKKYNLSEIMKKAWKLFKGSRKLSERFWITMSEAMKKAWAEAKVAVKANAIIAQKYFNFNISGCEVLINLGDGIVSGETYKCKETLKAYGLKFNGHEKYWEGSVKDIEDLVRAYA